MEKEDELFLVIVGNLLKCKRRELGLSQTEFAERLQVNQRTLSRYEKGDLEKPMRFVKICEALNTSVDSIVKEARNDYKALNQIGPQAKNALKTIIEGYVTD